LSESRIQGGGDREEGGKGGEAVGAVHGGRLVPTIAMVPKIDVRVWGWGR
jgi:hypothetical protein